MSDLTEALSTHVADLLSVETHVLQAVERQLDDDTTDSRPEAKKLITRVRTTLERHTERLESYREQLDPGLLDKVKEGVTAAMGAVAGLYDRLRDHTVTRMLRDDYTALSLIAVSATLLHTTALAFRDERVAQLALDILSDVTPLIVEISETIPLVVTAELAEKHGDIDLSVARTAVHNTQQTWSPVHTG